MKRGAVFKIAAVVLFSVLVAGASVAYRVFFPDAPPEVVRNVEEVAQRLNAAASASQLCLSLASIGRVTYLNFTAPIWCISARTEEKARFYVLLTGSIHGDEPAGAEFLLQFIENLAQSRAPRSDTAFDIIPLLNPWGWAHDVRQNGDGHDLNRDFATFQNQESVLIRDFVNARHYDLVVDVHEDRDATGFYMYRLANAEVSLCGRIIDSERVRGFQIEPNSLMFFLSVYDGVVSAPYWSLRLARTGRQLSMTNYIRMTNCPRVFLLETPLSFPMEQRLGMDALAVELLLGSLSAK